VKNDEFGRWIWAAIGFLAGWLGLKYLLPVLLPFIFGGILALAAEPAVKLLAKGTRLSRPAAAGLGVTVTLILLLGLTGLAGALAVKERGQLAGFLPDARQTLRSGVEVLRESAVNLADRLPEGVRNTAKRTITQLLSSDAVMTQKVTQKTGQSLTALLGKVPDGLLGIGTGVLAAYMISARLPKLRQSLEKKLPDRWRSRYLPALRRSRQILSGWLRAQGKLALATAGLLAVGFALLRIPYGFLWALPVALVDAVPVLGAGVVLLPWALVSFLQGQTFRGVGLLVLCAAAVILRRVLEPKWVGRHLDLDPLTTLVLFYLGYRFWGVVGMISAPLLAAIVRQLPGAADQME
jgi:sporulation integral membrane protein YtvI